MEEFVVLVASLWNLLKVHADPLCLFFSNGSLKSMKCELYIQVIDVPCVLEEK